MIAKYKLMLAVLAGVLIGAAGWAIYAQEVKTPPAYVYAEVNVTDPGTMQQYRAKLPETLAPYGHQVLISGGKTDALEGDAPKTIVLIAFDSMKDAREWYDSPAYQAIKPIREKAATSRVFIVDGITPK
jgi:uncharacterized protein (DUF1330 family)